MKGIKVIFFDAYGTFLSTGTGSVDACRAILARKGRQDIPPEEFYARWKQLHRSGMRRGVFRPEREIFAADLAALYEEYSVSGDPCQDVRLMLDSLLDRRAYPETAQVMAALGKKYRLMVASNTDTLPLMQNLEVNVLSFERVFTSEDLRCYKPAPEFYRTILSVAGVSADEALFAGDSPEEDVVAPTAAGMKAVFVDRRHSGADHGQYRTVNDLSGLPGLLL